MAVTITWSEEADGDAIGQPIDHGEEGAGNTTTPQTIYLRHDGLNPITNCRFYIAPYTGSYTGAATPQDDVAELLEWGDGVTAPTFGGFQINMDYINGFATGWPTYDDKQPADTSTFYTGVGDSADNGVLLSTAMGLGAAGVIQPSETDVAFQCRIEIPSTAALTGQRQFDQKLRFTYTS